MDDDMYRFLLTPRWVVGHLLVVLTLITFVNLGFWQLRRLDERREYNTLVTRRLDAAPVPLKDLVARVGRDPAALEFRRVVVTGRYLPGEQLLTAPRSRDGRPGPQVLTVLQGDGGTSVLVDRGWIPFDRDVVQAPPAPVGHVHVEGVVRGPEPGAIGDGDQVARIVPQLIGQRIGQPLPPFYVELWDQRPPISVAAPLPASPPALAEGSHQSYALQWFAFALIALIGYPMLIFRTAQGRIRRRADEPATGDRRPSMDSDHADMLSRPPHDERDRATEGPSEARR
jgi:cytochrome oxidase assembly protein ShyY1